MTEREMLELAAKAYGLDGWVWDEEMQAMRSPPRATSYGEAHAYWNPLADDGDALRLAVKLGMNVAISDEIGITDARVPSKTGWIVEQHWDDTSSATRLAITRVAAEIGRRIG